MTAVIIDDTLTALNALSALLKERCPDIQVVGTADTAASGIALVIRQKPQVVFLDVELPDMSGLDLMYELVGELPRNGKIVIYSAHTKYILRAMRAMAFDFLTKPINSDDFDEVIARLREMQTLPGNQAAAQEGEVSLAELIGNYSKREIRLRDVACIHYNSAQRRWELDVAGIDAPVPLRYNVHSKDLENLSPELVRVSKEYMVNINYVRDFSDDVCHFFPPFDNIKGVVISRRYRSQLKKYFK